VIRLTLAEVAEATGGTLAEGTDPAAAVTGSVTIDSRSVTAGDLFVAVPGERVDGHDYAAAAIEAGAVAVLAARPVPGPAVLIDDPVAALGRLAGAVRDRLPGLWAVGVTGSSGKTSTKDLLAAVLGAVGPTIAPPGSFNNELGVPLTVLRADEHTRFLVAEMGARGIGHIAYLCGIVKPRIGVVLNVGAAHAGEFGSRETTARAKGELVECLPPEGLAVLNADDPLVAGMIGRTRAHVVHTAVRALVAEVRAEAVRLDDEARATFELTTNWGTATVRLPLHGAHHVANALAAAAVGLEAGLDVDAVAAALTGARPSSRWRMEVTRRRDGLVVINDAYNANPDSVAAALRALAAMSRSGWAVLGEMLELGPASADEHRAVGRLAAGLGLAGVIAVGPGAVAVAEGAASGGIEARVAGGVDDAQALAEELRTAGRLDAVLIKASRSIGLERLAARLADDTIPAPATAPSTVSTLEPDGAAQ
jgi:UDP-N-acetylmuramoyl-tripeptide--D-alanyl-D-alanine ligase